MCARGTESVREKPNNRWLSFRQRAKRVHALRRVTLLLHVPRTHAHVPVVWLRTTVVVAPQLSEKLDSVRERAGTVLQKLVQTNGPQLPFVPERQAVQHAISHGAVDGWPAVDAAALEKQEAVNWASPAATFPVVVGLLAVPEYHDAIGERGVQTRKLSSP